MAKKIKSGGGKEGVGVINSADVKRFARDATTGSYVKVGEKVRVRAKTANSMGVVIADPAVMPRGAVVVKIRSAVDCLGKK